MEKALYNVLSLFDASGKGDAELEREIPLPATIISAWRRGVSHSYTKYLPRIAAFFGVSLDWLAETEQKEKSADPGEPTDLERILEKQPGLMFNGMPVTETDRKKLLTAMRIAMEIADREDKK